jgi:hypothetical protein
MIPVLGNIIAKLGLTLLSEKVVGHILVYTLQYFSKKTAAEIDDKIVATIAEALGVDIK